MYVDQAVMFGLASSAGVFGSTANMLVAIYTKVGFGPLKKWVDNFLVVCQPHQSWTEQEFMDLTLAIGILWSLEKLCPFASTQCYIGFDWNLERRSVSIPPDKLKATHSLISKVLRADARCSAREAVSLHSKLVHLACIYPLICPFLQSISYFAAGFKLQRARLLFPGPVQTNLCWILEILDPLPIELLFGGEQPEDIRWWGDARHWNSGGSMLECSSMSDQTRSKASLPRPKTGEHHQPHSHASQSGLGSKCKLTDQPCAAPPIKAAPDTAQQSAVVMGWYHVIL